MLKGQNVLYYYTQISQFTELLLGLEKISM